MRLCSMASTMGIGKGAEAKLIIKDNPKALLE
jgi:hypothetical protein